MIEVDLAAGLPASENPYPGVPVRWITDHRIATTC